MSIVEPRLVLLEEICQYLGDISPATYSAWRNKGIVPGPVPGTNRYDRKAHDRALDRKSGIDIQSAHRQLSALEAWEAGHAR